jgi:hypothetical protein
MAAREYNVCLTCGEAHADCRCEKPEQNHVAAYDSRDVDPLVKAARLALKELDYAPPGESERDCSFRIQAKWAVQSALAPFDGEEKR